MIVRPLETIKPQSKSSRFLKIVIIEGAETEPQIAVKIPLSGLKFVNALIPQKLKNRWRQTVSTLRAY